MLLTAVIGMASLAWAHPRAKLEPLLGDESGHVGVYIQVFSGGCTTNESFQVVTKVTDDVKKVYFYRVRPDYCRAFYRYGTRIFFSYDQLKIADGERFQIMNPRTTIIKH